MANLAYKTRGNSAPQGKPRVYFCCHPEDFNLFFEAVSEEILSLQNCAVWYPQDPAAPRDEGFLEDLREMQLFVMPVTAKLLYTENPARCKEFSFAMENHIPVLPLMQESGLAARFNQVCGNLQYLDQNQQDATALPYQEKLEQYLSSVLIGDELAEKIRAAFDAYVFLSYRKKDRRYARELMKLVHQNDFCRDIAIWYDEFLTPGENFNESIKDALQKSGLFLLTVTPNLVNEPNYIMTTEYPMAREEGKPILPAELVPTNKALLAEKYSGLPACADAHNEAELSDALLEAVKKLAIQENDRSPQHNFFIGLAYLGGVDVEVDHEKALSLITSAAQAGLLEAIGKLVEMYRTGLGVERNDDTALYWQRRKLYALTSRYGADPSEENLHTLFWEVIYCGDYYMETGQVLAADEQYKRGLDLATASPHLETAPRIKRALCVCYERLGMVFDRLGDRKKTRDYYEKSIALCTERAAENDPQAQRDLISSCSALGDTYMTNGKLSTAHTYYEKALTVSKALAEQFDDTTAREDLAFALSKLGDLCFAERDLAAAKEYYENALSLYTALAQELQTPSAQRELFSALTRMGDVHLLNGALSDARAHYEKAVPISEELAGARSTLTAQQDLSIAYEKLGDLYRTLGENDRAREAYEKMLKAGLAAEKTVSNQETRRDLEVCYEKLGDFCKGLGDLDGAKTYYDRSFALCLELAKESGTAETRRALLLQYERQGDLALETKDFTKAAEHYLNALSISTALAEETGTAVARRGLAVNYNKLGHLHKDMGDLATARNYYEKGFAISQELAEEINTPESLEDLAMAYCNIAGVLPQKKFRLFSADPRTQYLQEALSIYETLCRACPETPSYRLRYAALQQLLKSK